MTKWDPPRALIALRELLPYHRTCARQLREQLAELRESGSRYAEVQARLLRHEQWISLLEYVERQLVAALQRRAAPAGQTPGGASVVSDNPQSPIPNPQSGGNPQSAIRNPQSGGNPQSAIPNPQSGGAHARPA
jgi:hypothetical protein